MIIFKIIFFEFSGFGWLARQSHLLCHPELRIEENDGPNNAILKLKISFGILKKSADKIIHIGDQQIEMLPNGEEVKVNISGLMLCISTSIWMLHIPNTSLNMQFHFFAKNLKKEEQAMIALPGMADDKVY